MLCTRKTGCAHMPNAPSNQEGRVTLPAVPQ
jgi:hypothetical protein